LFTTVFALRATTKTRLQTLKLELTFTSGWGLPGTCPLSNRRAGPGISKGVGMLEYRIYMLDHYGHIFRAEDFRCNSDEQAMIKALELSGGATVEIWQYARVVGRIPGKVPLGAMPEVAPAPRRVLFS
jgi:hypothetical protein